MPLTELAVRTAKGKEKPYKLADSGGLYIFVQPTGSRLWRMNYRFNGKYKTLALGAYPIIGLADARTRRDEAKKQIARGVDPGLKKKLDRLAFVASSENTFAKVASDYLDRLEHDGAAESTMAKNRWLLEKLANADLGSRPINEITSMEILALLQRVERSGRLETARRLQSVISSVYRLAIVTLRAATDPTFPLQGATKAPKVVNHPAITDPKKLGALLNSIDVYDGWPTLRCALQFTALVACRPGEVRCAEWSEFDVRDAKWTIPAQRTKTRREHDVPLCRQALAVLDDISGLTGGQRLVFSSIRSIERPLSEGAMNSALRRMGYLHEEHTPHGFRSSFSTILNERNFNPEIIEMCLAHQEGNAVRGAYNRSTKWDERVKLMSDWADMLDEFRKF